MKLQLSIFKNTHKEKPNQPDYRISMVGANGGFQKVGGGWIKETKTGDKYISCSIDTEQDNNPSMVKNVQPDAPQTLTADEKAILDKARQIEIDAKTKQNSEITDDEFFNSI
jgi:uncharacterized protein (DUF736 family)